ncbi:YhgE/Pip domain-containing protein [Alkalihalobacillus hwajinpoensis]|uniref:YhgE/Pip domain-containing protein n=1 Tax=Guptibacillus hwajinpoensis TaxID=208199 RepID=UPI0018833128|nr:YhgE/Pip domain-containing protein [Pseudalkalibacillus hwajinpoensis]MBF0706875.1 YhgE/Pip domain-containing protein [Pseudalkalibacillus hwajinpoensis]
MKNILRIFKKDWKGIGSNWVAAILLGGLIILPSLYAWFNIGASWDPYSQTDQLPVGIVNEDKGATIRDKEIDAGGELTKELKDNDSLEWHFSNREAAMDKLEYGDYFAVIVIPEDFSEKLGTVINDEPEKAEVEYYVNEKVNAIAPKITEKGASVIVDQITSNFVSVVNGTIFDVFNDLGVEFEKDLSDIKQFEEYVFKLEENLPEINRLISDALSDSRDAENVINKVQGLLPEAQQITSEGISTIDETTQFLNESEDRLNKLAPQVEEDLTKAQQTAEDVNKFLSDLKSPDIDLSSVEEIRNQINQQVDDSVQRIDDVQGVLKQVQEASDNNENVESQEEGEESRQQRAQEPSANSQQQEVIDEAIADLDQVKEQLQTIKADSGEIGSTLADKQEEIDDILTTLQEKSGETADRIDSFLKEYKEDIEPRVLAEVASAKKTLSNARSTLKEAQTTIPEVERILSSTEENIGEGQDILAYMLNEYPYVNDKVNQLADRIREIQGETDINEIIDLLKNDPMAEQSFFAEPIVLSKNSLFPIQNYGTGMTPFYTVLSLWVGALLLVSLLTTEATGFEEASNRQVYFGKLLTFISIGFLQTLVVTSGDLFILNVDIVNPVLFVLFGLVISFVFMLMVYTLVAVFGDVGKAMAIVFLVLQIAGSGGTYPVALLPEFFQAIHPYLPFSYAVDLMREAVGGIVWARAKEDLFFLGIFSVVFLLIGAVLKEVIIKKTKYLMKKSRESGLFH